MKRIHTLKELSLFLVILMIASSCARNPVTGRRQMVLMSEKQEIRMGQEYDPQIVAAFGEYKNDAMLAFIQEKGREMGKLSHRPNLEYHFRILDSPVINAFALPGGYIYFTRGILAQFSSEAELMGVLGHEMGHITARHIVSRQSRQQLGQLVLIGGMIASEEFRRYGQFAMAGMEILFLKFSRDDERESDRLGVEYSMKMGYDGRKMGDFFQVLEKMNMASDHAGIPNFLSSHPNPGDRYTDVHRHVERWQAELGKSEWLVNEENYLAMIDGMVFGEDPRQGYVEGNAFYHPELKFQFQIPQGWDLENAPHQVRMGPKDRNALIVFTISPQNTLDDAARQSLSQLGLNVVEIGRSTVNNMPAIAALSNQSSQGQTIQVLSYFIDYQGTYYAFHGVSASENFAQYRPMFEATMTNFQTLTDASKLNVQPIRIRIQKAPQAGTLREVFGALGVQENQMEQVAFLNNMELTETVSQGQPLKMVGK
jgi:predicted Zn-dependent protease